MLKKLSLILISILMLTQMLFSIQKLEFSKRRNFGFGDGEYGKVRLELKNYDTYNYQSEIKKPFVMKKGNNGIVELIYDIRLVDDENKEIDKVYKTSFTFVKKNIGKRERIYLSAKYKPEIQIVENDTLFSTYTQVQLSPDKPSAMVYLNSVKKYYDKFNAEYDKNLIGILSDTNLKFGKGINTLEISLARSENFEKEIVMYRPVGNSKINQLFITVKSSGFEEAVVEEVVDENTDTTDVSLTEDGSYDTDEYAISEPDGLVDDRSDNSGMGFISIIIIVIMGIVIIILIALLIIGKKGGLYEKYETFFLDIASIINIEAKGNNIDKVIEEIMMILLDKFETPYGKEHKEDELLAPKPKPETKEIKTINTKKAVKPEVTTPKVTTPKVTTPKVTTPESMGEDLDLDFGSTDDKTEEIPVEEKLKEVKPLNKKSLISSGFDFDDLNPEGDEIEIEDDKK
ncbi:MAG: hypothetical protein PF638_07170 [Candidatus Delongbacteria bacterium]|jgi:hypothetical protein|nr:hypothetical protein [Candidatus Delongbacteria bacterium]